MELIASGEWAGVDRPWSRDRREADGTVMKLHREAPHDETLPCTRRRGEV